MAVFARRSFCCRLCIKLGIRVSKVAAPGKHLPYEDVSMEQVRVFVRTAPQRLGVHERLICNFDQAAWLNFCVSIYIYILGFHRDSPFLSMYIYRISLCVYKPKAIIFHV